MLILPPADSSTSSLYHLKLDGLGSDPAAVALQVPISVPVSLTGLGSNVSCCVITGNPIVRAIVTVFFPTVFAAVNVYIPPSFNETPLMVRVYLSEAKVYLLSAVIRVEFG